MSAGYYDLEVLAYFDAGGSPQQPQDIHAEWEIDFRISQVVPEPSAIGIWLTGIAGVIMIGAWNRYRRHTGREPS